MYVRVSDGSLGEETLVVLGGMNSLPSLHVYESVYAYTPARSSTWLPVLPLPAPQAAFAVAVADLYVYVLGGSRDPFAETNPLPSVWRLDLLGSNQSAWAALAPLPQPCSAASAQGLGSLVYVVGGYDGQHALGQTAVYDPAADTWTLGPALNTPRYALATAVLAGALYAIGGLQRAGAGPLSSVERLDAGAAAWVGVAALPTARAGLAALSLDGSIYAAGGHAADGKSVGDTATYSPDAWNSVGSLAVARQNFSLAVLNGSLYALGGCDKDGFATLSIEMYATATHHWAVTTLFLPTPLQAFGAVVVRTWPALLPPAGPSSSSSRLSTLAIGLIAGGAVLVLVVIVLVRYRQRLCGRHHGYSAFDNVPLASGSVPVQYGTHSYDSSV